MFSIERESEKWKRQRMREREKATERNRMDKNENDAYVESDKHICPDTLQSEYSWYDVAQPHALQVKQGSFDEMPDHQLQWRHGEMWKKREEKRKTKRDGEREKKKNNVSKPIFILRFVCNLVFYTQSILSSWFHSAHIHMNMCRISVLVPNRKKFQEEWEQEWKRTKSLIFYFGPVVYNRINTYVELLPLPHT